MVYAHSSTMVTPEHALPGREHPIVEPGLHFVLGTPLAPPVPDGLERAIFAMGCFWGAEKAMWTLPGIFTTAVGYTAGITPNPTYDEVCTGRTGHTEAVLVVFDPQVTTFAALTAAFFEHHDPTQYMRQGNDIGTQYRSGIYPTSPKQRSVATTVASEYGARLAEAGYGSIATEIVDAGPFFYAEEYHQQYLAKNPWGYCGLGGTGVACPVGLLGDSTTSST
jgi:peptide-methionine (S)-S-oxide reductase